MLRAIHLIAALLITALSPAALAQKSSGHMDLDDLGTVYGAQLAVFRVMISKTDAICPQQTGLFRIAPNGLVTDVEAIMRLVPELPRSDGKIVKGMDLSPVPAPDDFTYRRRLAMESCRIDIDISEQQKQDGEWIPLLSLQRPNAPSSRKNDDPPVVSSTGLEAFHRHMRAREHAGNLLQGWTGTFKSVVGFEGAKDCFDAIATYRIDQLGVTLLFRPAWRESSTGSSSSAWIPMRTTARSISRVVLAASGLRSARPFCAMAPGFHSPSRHQEPGRALTPDLPLAATPIRLRQSLSPTRPGWKNWKEE